VAIGSASRRPKREASTDTTRDRPSLCRPAVLGSSSRGRGGTLPPQRPYDSGGAVLEGLPAPDPG
jgi:hypothetical protein